MRLPSIAKITERPFGLRTVRPMPRESMMAPTNIVAIK